MANYKGAATEATRAMHILKRREKAREELEQKKRKFEEDLKLDIDKKFATHYDSIESQLRTSTVGLVTLSQMREKQELAVREREKQLAQGEKSNRKLDIEDPKKDSCHNKKRNKLSFGYGEEDDDDDDDDDEDEEHEKNGNGKSDVEINQSKICNGESDKEGNTSSQSNSQLENKLKKRRISFSELDLDTSYLPDRRREEEEKKLREQLALQWRETQAKLKEEDIEITFSYWDGSGHRRVAMMKKGHSIFQFLQKCLEVLRKDFNELRAVTADQIMYVKEDLIIPHHYTFYDFIVTKARGKSGPLFSFDVHDDVRLIADARVEKDESHAGKVLLRSWYERNKHIFPASRWEPYDPTKSYEKYTISDKKSK